MTKVVHCKYERFDVYIGRHQDPIIGKWGNPFSHKEDTLAEFKVATREESIAKYQKWIIKQPQLLKELKTLKGKVLGCWCKTPGNPNKSCHGDVLVLLIESKFLF